MPFVAVAEGSPDSASVAGGDENSMGKARNSLDPTKPQFSQVELCEVAEIRMATAELDFDRSSSAGGCLFSVVTIFVVVHPTKRADLSRHGYRAAQFEDAFARFLTIRAEHPNTQAWGRRKDVKVFGCSDDCARCGTAKTVCQLAKGFALDIPWSRGCERAENEQHYPADEGSAGGRS
jgi:hypothetical protein